MRDLYPEHVPIRDLYSVYIKHSPEPTVRGQTPNKKNRQQFEPTLHQR